PKANRRTDERADRPERRKSERLCRDESTGDQSDETEGHRDRDPRRPVGSGIERAHPGGDPDGEGCESRDTENDREKVDKRHPADRCGEHRPESEKSGHDDGKPERAHAARDVPERVDTIAREGGPGERIRAHSSPPTTRCIRRSTYCEPRLRTKTVTNRTTPAANSALRWVPLAMPYWLAIRLVSVIVLPKTSKSGAGSSVTFARMTVAAIGSPAAPRTPNTTAAEPPEQAAGSVTSVVVCQSVAPSASEPSFIAPGTLSIASSATETTVGSAIAPMTTPTTSRLPSVGNPKLSDMNGLRTVKPMKP